MGRAINGGEKVTSDNSARPGRHSLPLTSCCFSNADLVVVPPAGSQTAEIAAEINGIPWECKDDCPLGRVRRSMCMHLRTRSMRKKTSQESRIISCFCSVPQKCDAAPSLTEGGRTRGSQSPLI